MYSRSYLYYYLIILNIIFLLRKKSVMINSFYEVKEFCSHLKCSLYIFRRWCCSQRFEIEGRGTKFTKTSGHCKSWFCWFHNIKGSISWYLLHNGLHLDPNPCFFIFSHQFHLIFFFILLLGRIISCSFRWMRHGLVFLVCLYAAFHYMSW